MSSWLAKAMNAAVTITSNKDSIKRYTICVYVHIQGTRLQEKKMVTGMIPICSLG